MKNNQASKSSKVPGEQLFNKEKSFFPSLIFIIWLITYITFTLIFEQKLGWDEVSYLSVAKGIAEDFDFSSRHYTIMGILKYGYPSNLINFPIHSFYIAILFKLFGASIHVAYFSTWFAALGVCLLIYYIFLLVSEGNKKLAFVASMSYLFSPGIIKNCDTAMMEQLGCFLLCFFLYLVLKDLSRGQFGHLLVFKFAFSFLILWLYKSIYVAYIFGAFILICSLYNVKITEKSIKSKIPLPVFLLSSYGLFTLLFYLVKKYIFLPVTPMMNFTSEQDAKQLYADFLGGFFNNFSKNLMLSIGHFFDTVVAPYFIYPSTYHTYYPEVFKLTGSFIVLGLYFFIFFIVIALTFSSWKKLAPIARIFIIFTFFSIIFFNLVFNLLFMSNHSNIWRYNFYYLPIFICTFWLVAAANFEYVKPFFRDHPGVSKGLILLFLVFVYLPLFLTTLNQYIYYEKWFHDTAKQNTVLIKTFVKDTKPKFVYFNDGTHTIFVDYPIRWIFKDATNGQLLQVNKILPKPIELLFLRSNDWLYKINKESILQRKPILDDSYEFNGFDEETGTVVYRLNSRSA